MPTSGPNIKAVLFDLDNTLYEYAPCDQAGRRAVCQWLADQLNIPQRTIRQRYNASRHQVHQQLNGQAASHARLLYIKYVLEQTTNSKLASLALQAEQVFWRAYFTKMQLRPGVIKLLHLLTRQNIKLAIVTDLTTQIQLQKIKRLRLERYFDYIVTSEEVGHEKPHPALIKLALKKLGISPKQTVLIGDSLSRDQVVAKRCGIGFIQLSTTTQVNTVTRQCNPSLIK